SLDDRLDRMRDRTGIPKSRLVEELADEAERSRRYPGLAFRGDQGRRRAWVVGTHFDVWEIILAWQDLDQDERATLEQIQIQPRHLRLALAYHREFPDEIETALRLQRRSLYELAREYPFIDVARPAR
ncbi:MAG: hypothetical protein J2P45_18045, partial [Candidatus Dormibacteraeota bacterium]|nr:hypothetical protein [Candidatus Dormibacteraeota bacterium]